MMRVLGQTIRIFLFSVCLVSTQSAKPAWAGAGGGWIEFTDETASRLVADPGVGVSDGEEKDYAWGDVDNDGDIDIVCVRKQPFTTPGRRTNVLFMNEGIVDGQAKNGVFVDRTSQFMVDADDGGQGFLDLTNDRDVILADVNNDLWLDIITVVTISDGLPKTISHPRIYMNLGEIGGVWQGCRYEEGRIPQLFTIPGGQAVAPRLCAIAAGDVTGDGFVDLYIGDYDSGGVGGATPEDPNDDVNDRLLINNGAGFFTDSLETRMTGNMLLSAFSMAVAIEDMNGDGAMDVVKDTALNFPQRISISYNDPANVGFFDVFDVIYNNAPYHITVGDLNNDGLPDVVVTDDGQDGYLLNTGNDGAGSAQFISFAFDRFGAVDSEFGGNSVIADLDNDGFNDVAICDIDVDSPGCNRRLHLYRNLGDVPNVTLQEQSGFEPWTAIGSHDVAIFDIDGDGWKDMFIGTCSGTKVWINQPPGTLLFSYPDGMPSTLTPNVVTQFRVTVTGDGTTPQSGTGKQFVSIDGGPFVESVMAEDVPNTYFINLPGVACASEVRYYVQAEMANASLVSDPIGAPINTYSALAIFGTELLIDERFEAITPSWTATNDASLTGGAWERVDPVGTFFPSGSGLLAQPEDDAGAGAETMCFITEQHVGGGDARASDVDFGPATLTSPVIDLSGSDAIIEYARWHFSGVGGASIPDALLTEVSNDGVGWTPVHDTFDTNRAWEVVSFRVGDFVTPTATVQVRFVVEDASNNSITESGIDNFTVTRLLCDSCIDDIDCIDSLFCNGDETCIGGSCVPGTNPCPFGCDELNDVCTGCGVDADCDDGLFCSGMETCVGNVCTAGTDPCPGQLCDDGLDVCVDCLDATDCDDSVFCNGAEQCDGGLCVAGADPCPGQLCDEGGAVCFDCSSGNDCDDGLFCNGVETCVGGDCIAGTAPCAGQFCDEPTQECVIDLQPRMGDPVRNLTPSDLVRFLAGRVKFDEVLTEPNGLGPIFNQNACGACHSVGGLGGTGTILVTRFGQQDKSGFNSLASLGGSLLQAQSIDPVNCQEVVPAEANIVASRITTGVFGAGLVEAVPDPVLLDLAVSPPAGISGVAHMVGAFEDPMGAPLHVGRFGWKSQVATVLTFSADAAQNEMGLTNRFIPTENDPNGTMPPELGVCDAVPDPEDGPDGEGFDFIDRVTDFQRFLAPPPQTPRGGMTGEAIFVNIGCSDCHAPTFITGTAAEAALTNQVIKPYSDFLVHGMGTLGDGIEQGGAGVTEMRTVPLWGLRVRDAMLHDGRVLGGLFADRIDSVINWHNAPGSEAATAASAYAALLQTEKDALVAFLDSLGRAEFDHDGDGDVDLSDLATFGACLTGPSSGPYTPDDGCAISDIEQNGSVNLFDYSLFQRAFTGSE